jgi:DNA invertase Pin-like site-specific DNA recombinase
MTRSLKPCEPGTCSNFGEKSAVTHWSISAQKHEFERHCYQKSWQVFKVYIEGGKSARFDSIEKRPQFTQLLED